MSEDAKRCPNPEHEGANPLPTSEFSKNRGTKDGLKSWCKACCSRRYRQAHPVRKNGKIPRHRYPEVWHLLAAGVTHQEVAAQFSVTRQAVTKFARVHAASIDEVRRGGLATAWAEFQRSGCLLFPQPRPTPEPEYEYIRNLVTARPEITYAEYEAGTGFALPPENFYNVRDFVLGHRPLGSRAGSESQ